MTAPILEQNGAPFYPEGAAIVIGGSGGMGAAICARLAEHGTDVALTYRSNAAAAEAAVAAVEGAGQKAFSQALSLTDPAAVGRFVREVAEWSGSIHTLIYAVGADISMVYVNEVDRSEWLQTIDNDLNGFFHVVQAVLPYLRDGGGSILALTSAGVLRHPPKDILSTVPKAGIEALVRGVAREEGRFGIRANSLALGVIATGLFHRLEQRVTPAFVEAMKGNTALRRFGGPREVADAAVYLSSNAASFITGVSIPFDGGYCV